MRVVVKSGLCLILSFVLLQIEMMKTSKSAVTFSTTEGVGNHLVDFAIADRKDHPSHPINPLTPAANRALKRPYQIFQLGDPRSASTFQFELICSMATWKTQQQTGRKKIPCRFIKFKQMENTRFHRKLQESIDSNQTFVYKAHNDPGLLKQLALTYKIAVFSSGGVGSSFALYTQNYDTLQQCPECEIERYQAYFELSPTEVEQLKRHMKSFGVIRRCCGFQMSKYEMQRLHGCNVIKYGSPVLPSLRTVWQGRDESHRRCPCLKSRAISICIPRIQLGEARRLRQIQA